MSYLKGGEILIDISYHHFTDVVSQYIDINVLKEKEQKQILSLLDKNGKFKRNIKRIILKLYIGSNKIYAVLDRASTDFATVVGYINIETELLRIMFENAGPRLNIVIL